MKLTVFGGIKKIAGRNGKFYYQVVVPGGKAFCSVKDNHLEAVNELAERRLMGNLSFDVSFGEKGIYLKFAGFEAQGELSF